MMCTYNRNKKAYTAVLIFQTEHAFFNIKWEKLLEKIKNKKTTAYVFILELNSI